MKSMASIFIGVIFYGSVTSNLVGALLVIVLLIFVIYGSRHMDKHVEPCESPDSTTEELSTPKELKKEDCESSASKF